MLCCTEQNAGVDAVVGWVGCGGKEQLCSNSLVQMQDSDTAKTWFTKVKIRSQPSCALGKGEAPCSPAACRGWEQGWGCTTMQVVEGAQTWCVAAKIPETQRRFNYCQGLKIRITIQKSTKVSKWVASRKKYIFLQQRLCLSCLYLAKMFTETEECTSPRFLQALVGANGTRYAEMSREVCRKERRVERWGKSAWSCTAEHQASIHPFQDCYADCSESMFCIINIFNILYYLLRVSIQLEEKPLWSHLGQDGQHTLPSGSSLNSDARLY